MVGALLLAGAAYAEPPASRYVSAQAYHHALEAGIREASGDVSGAIDALEHALVYDPDSVHLSIELSRLLAAAGELHRADRLIQRALARAPRSAAALRVRASIAAAEHDTREVERALRLAFRAEPATSEGAAAAVELAAVLGRTLEAELILERAAAAARWSPRPLAALAEHHAARGHFDDALAAARRALSRAPDDDALWSLMADLLDRAGRLEAAAEHWRKRIERTRGIDARVLLGAARAELRLGRVDRAKSLIASAVRIEPAIRPDAERLWLEQGRDLAREGARR